MWEDYLVIEMQREVISGLSPGQLPFCSLCRALQSSAAVASRRRVLLPPDRPR